MTPTSVRRSALGQLSECCEGANAFRRFYPLRSETQNESSPLSTASISAPYLIRVRRVPRRIPKVVPEDDRRPVRHDCVRYPEHPRQGRENVRDLLGSLVAEREALVTVGITRLKNGMPALIVALGGIVATPDDQRCAVVDRAAGGAGAPSARRTAGAR